MMSSTDRQTATPEGQSSAGHVVTGLTCNTHADVRAGSTELRHEPQVAAMGTEAAKSSVVAGSVEAGFEGVRDAFAAAADPGALTTAQAVSAGQTAFTTAGVIALVAIAGVLFVRMVPSPAAQPTDVDTLVAEPALLESAHR